MVLASVSFQILFLLKLLMFQYRTRIVVAAPPEVRRVLPKFVSTSIRVWCRGRRRVNENFVNFSAYQVGRGVHGARFVKNGSPLKRQKRRKQTGFSPDFHYLHGDATYEPERSPSPGTAGNLHAEVHDPGFKRLRSRRLVDRIAASEQERSCN
jgi:hypothetical protein